MFIFQVIKILSVTILMDVTFRKIEKDDYFKQYIKLLFSFSNYECQISYDDFSKYIENMTDTYIIVAEDLSKNIIVGTGSIFILKKIHNNKNAVGFIQDVVVDENYRKMKIGSTIVQQLIDIGKEKLCYKVILNCSDENKKFYEKNGFHRKGNEMEIR